MKAHVNLLCGQGAALPAARQRCVTYAYAANENSHSRAVLEPNPAILHTMKRIVLISYKNYFVFNLMVWVQRKAA